MRAGFNPYLYGHHLGILFLQIIFTVFYVSPKDFRSHIERFTLKEQQETLEQAKRVNQTYICFIYGQDQDRTI